MIEAKGGVSKKLEDKVSHPICIIHCVAHKLELAVLDAVKRCPYLPTFEDTVKEVYKFNYYSTKRRRELNEIANIIDGDAVYYSGLQKTKVAGKQIQALLLPWRSTMSVLLCTCSIKQDPLVKMGHVPREF